jgi:hypothetical protein
MLLRKVCVGLGLLIVACNSGGGDPDGGAPPPKDSGPLDCSDAGAGTSFPCDIAPIIESKCQRCHNEPAVLSTCLANNSCDMGPFPLVTWSDTRRPFGTGRVVDALPDVIEKKAMPFMDPMLVPPVEPLTDDEWKKMVAWARSCAPAAPMGTAACGP